MNNRSSHRPAAPPPAGSHALPEDELELATMRLVHERATVSQRELASRLGVSVGKTNFVLRALLGKGLVKVENFRRSDNKLGYLYLLTPRGLSEKARLTRDFIARKELEYEGLRAQIHILRAELEDLECARRGTPSSSTATSAPSRNTDDLSA